MIRTPLSRMILQSLLTMMPSILILMKNTLLSSCSMTTVHPLQLLSFPRFKLCKSHHHQHPSYDFGISSSSSDPINEQIHIDDQDQSTLGGETKSNPPKVNLTENNPSPSESPINKDGDKPKCESSTSDTRSSAENYADPLSQLEL